MPAPIPSHILAPMISGDNPRNAAGCCEPAVPPVGSDKVSRLHTRSFRSSASQAETGRGDQVGTPTRVPAEREPFGVVQRNRGRRIPEELRYADRPLVLQIAAPKHIVTAAAIHGVV